jgi:hypothetical protein
MSWQPTLNQRQRLIRFRNDSGVTIPVDGVMRLGHSEGVVGGSHSLGGNADGFDSGSNPGNFLRHQAGNGINVFRAITEGGGDHIWRAWRPNESSEAFQDPMAHFFNCSGMSVKKDEYGWGSMDFPSQAIYDGDLGGSETATASWASSPPTKFAWRREHGITATSSNPGNDDYRFSPGLRLGYAGLKAGSFKLHVGYGDAYTILDHDYSGPYDVFGVSEVKNPSGKVGQRLWVVPTLRRPGSGCMTQFTGSGAITDIVGGIILGLGDPDHITYGWDLATASKKIIVGQDGWYRVSINCSVGVGYAGPGYISDTERISIRVYAVGSVAGLGPHARCSFNVFDIEPVDIGLDIVGGAIQKNLAATWCLWLEKDEEVQVGMDGSYNISPSNISAAVSLGQLTIMRDAF